MQNASYSIPMIGGVVINRLRQEPDKYQEIRDLREEPALVFRALVAEGIKCGDLPKD